MSSDIAICVKNLSKCYQIYETPRDRLKQFIFPRIQRTFGVESKPYYYEFWALKDISFEVIRGETVGIIGRNGSGKSTLLQMICGTLNPTSGSVITNGRIAALLELGSGFNPEFTGVENVYMSCALLGLSKAEIDVRFDDIAAFADIGEFINRPVKTYSSGMFVRLAFAVNVVSSPQIMVVDEALAVGDMNFQAKCMTALTRFQERGGTVLFVSHDVGAVKSLCQKAIYLESGRLVCSGFGPDIAEHYVRSMREEMNNEALKLTRASSNFSSNKNKSVEVQKLHIQIEKSSSKKHTSNSLELKYSEEFNQRVKDFRYGMGGAKILFVELLDLSDNPVILAEFNQRVKVRIHFEVQQEIELSVNYYIQDDRKNLIIGAALRTLGHQMLRCREGSKHIATYTTNLPLQEGNYSIQVQITKPVVFDHTADFLDVIENAVVFNVARRPSGRLWTKVYLENEFIDYTE